MDRAFGWLVAAAALAAGGDAVEAQAPRATGAIVVVVESSDPAIRPEAFRRQLADELAVPVSALGTSDGVSSLVVIQVAGDGPARVHIQRPSHPPRRLTVERGAARWLVEGVLDALGRASLVTWEGEARPAAGPRLAEWEEPSEPRKESGTALDPPPR